VAKMYQIVFGVTAFAMVGAVTLPVRAQDFVLDGFYNCAKATNGRPYCQQVGKGANYFPVTDEFLQLFFSARTGSVRPAPGGTPAQLQATQPSGAGGSVVQLQQNITTINNTVVVDNLKKDASEARGLIALYSKMIAEQKNQSSKDGGDASEAANQAIAILNARIETLRQSFTTSTTELSRYQTSIRPNDPDMRISARKASELFPKVPWYVPGTSDVGEFWLEPLVTDDGSLKFNMRFVDPSAEGDKKIKSTFNFTKDDLVAVQQALLKLIGWAKVAHQKGVKQVIKTVDCFPKQSCVPEDQRKPGITSTEIVFQVNDEGATSGRIQRNKGKFKEGYNISIESTVWLQAYLNHIIIEGTDEFDAGSRTKADVDSLFK